MPKKEVTKKEVIKKEKEVEVPKSPAEEIFGKGKYFYAVGKRKRAIARVKFYKTGSGQIKVNSRDFKNYFPTAYLQETIVSPLKLVNQLKDHDIEVKVIGGGVRGQADSVRHGIAKALILFDPEQRKTVKKVGFLTRDARKKERKKPGLKKARRAPQWQKR